MNITSGNWVGLHLCGQEKNIVYVDYEFLFVAITRKENKAPIKWHYNGNG